MIVESSVVVPIPPALAFAVSQTTGETRLRWDPFIRRQRSLTRPPRPPRASAPSPGTGPGAVSEYVFYQPPTNVGMKMVDGPWFFAVMAGGWRFTALPDGGTRAVWRYSFTCGPHWLAPARNGWGARAAARHRPPDRRLRARLADPRSWRRRRLGLLTTGMSVSPNACGSARP